MLEDADVVPLGVPSEVGPGLDAAASDVTGIGESTEASQGDALKRPNGGAVARVAAGPEPTPAREEEASGEAHRSVIAGYHWFTDWGRDTMISLPGLCLCTGRLDEARDILRTFGGFVDRGMLPNVFPSRGEPPAYNTADATLWYFHALEAERAASRSISLIHELFPVLAEIIEWHQGGTRYGIAVDPADGLLRAGVPGVQLTWMDAWFGDTVVTPRIGKPVEINALWYQALQLMAEWSAAMRKPARSYEQAAAQARRSFNERFWLPEAGHLANVIDGPQGDEPRLRPNQLLAISLPHAVLDRAHWHSVLDACARALYTPAGPRSLDARDPAYAGTYSGDRPRRERAYHQGTAWGWLIGPYLDAHLRVFGDPTATRALKSSRLCATCARPVWAASAKSSTAMPRTRRAAASLRRGAWRRCCACGRACAARATAG